MIKDKTIQAQEFPEAYFEWKADKEHLNQSKQQIKNEMRFMNRPENFELGYYGRLSPFAKEILYREYQKGMTVKDLSLKYGIL